ncbi:magnesium and cobalt transport protein CorA [soil metagenome]
MIQQIASFSKSGASKELTVSPDQLPTRVATAKRAGGFVWVGLIEPDEAELAQFAEALDLHPLAVADAVHGKQAPKLQNYPQHLFVVAWSLVRPPRSSGVGEIMIFARAGLLLTVQREMGKDAIDVAAALAADPGVLALGAVGGLYRILADLVIGYTEEAGRVEKKLEELEQQVFDRTLSESEEDLYRLRQRIGKLSRAVSAITASLTTSRDHLDGLVVGQEKLGPHLQDLLDDLAGTSQLVDDQGHALDGVLASHENNIARQQGEDTRRISAIAALLSVPAVIAGLYGMNFKDLPGTEGSLGWLWVAGAIVVIDSIVFATFKRRNWL